MCRSQQVYALCSLKIEILTAAVEDPYSVVCLDGGSEVLDLCRGTLFFNTRMLHMCHAAVHLGSDVMMTTICTIPVCICATAGCAVIAALNRTFWFAAAPAMHMRFIVLTAAAAAARHSSSDLNLFAVCLHILYRCYE